MFHDLLLTAHRGSDMVGFQTFLLGNLFSYSSGVSPNFAWISSFVQNLTRLITSRVRKNVHVLYWKALGFLLLAKDPEIGAKDTSDSCTSC